MLGISVDDPGYWNETRGMAKDLRDKARRLITDKYDDDEHKAAILNKVLDDAEEVTELRNRALHSVWMNEPGRDPFLLDRDKTSRTHINYRPPSPSDLATISGRIQRVQRVLDGLTRDLL